MEQVLLRQQNNEIIVESQSYANEEELQELIKNNPGIINLSSIFDNPLMVIGRESYRIDVMALTADAVPVIIECKRKDNPDMRDIIAQVFEYASKLKQRSFNELDDTVTKYFASDRCREEIYKDESLSSAYKIFIENLGESFEAEEVPDLAASISARLKNAEFYLIIVVDKISEVAYDTVRFLNDKLEKLRIEIIEISKFSDTERTIYVPNHINRAESRKTKSQPGKITYDEMINSCGTKEAAYIKNFKASWDVDDNYSIVMGTKGFSARYNDVPILWVLPDYIQITPGLKKKYGQIFVQCQEMLKKHFSDTTETTVTFNVVGFNTDKLKLFIDDVKNIAVSQIG